MTDIKDLVNGKISEGETLGGSLRVVYEAITQCDDQVFCPSDGGLADLVSLIFYNLVKSETLFGLKGKQRGGKRLNRVDMVDKSEGNFLSWDDSDYPNFSIKLPIKKSTLYWALRELSSRRLIEITKFQGTTWYGSKEAISNLLAADKEV